MSKFDEIDWEAIAKQLPKSEDTRIQSGRLADRDYWILKAGTASKKRQLAPDTASLLTAQVRRFEDEWFKNIQFQAAQAGITFEEMFIRLATGE